MKLRLPNTFVLLFALLAVIAAATWLVPGGRFETELVDGKPWSWPAAFTSSTPGRRAWSRC
jgi:uncharacterized ion transporter superfamily protein YfcC